MYLTQSTRPPKRFQQCYKKSISISSSLLVLPLSLLTDILLLFSNSFQTLLPISRLDSLRPDSSHECQDPLSLVHAARQAT